MGRGRRAGPLPRWAPITPRCSRASEWTTRRWTSCDGEASYEAGAAVRGPWHGRRACRSLFASGSGARAIDHGWCVSGRDADPDGERTRRGFRRQPADRAPGDFASAVAPLAVGPQGRRHARGGGQSGHRLLSHDTVADRAVPLRQGNRLSRGEDRAGEGFRVAGDRIAVPCRSELAAAGRIAGAGGRRGAARRDGGVCRRAVRRAVRSAAGPRVRDLLADRASVWRDDCRSGAGHRGDDAGSGDGGAPEGRAGKSGPACDSPLLRRRSPADRAVAHAASGRPVPLFDDAAAAVSWSGSSLTGLGQPFHYRHGRAWPGHPRLRRRWKARESWMAGTGAGHDAERAIALSVTTAYIFG